MTCPFHLNPVPDTCGWCRHAAPKAFEIGDRVTVTPSFWMAAYRGKNGRIVRTGEAAEGGVTHWVRFDEGGGQFILAEDLRRAE